MIDFLPKNKAIKKGMALGSVSAAIFSGCGGEQTSVTSDKSLKQEGNVAAAGVVAPQEKEAKNKQPTPPAQNLGSTALDGCDLNQTEAFLKDRMKDEKWFTAKRIDWGGNNVMISTLSNDTMIVDSLIATCENNNQIQHSASIGIEYTPEDTAENKDTYPLKILPSSNTKTIALARGGTSALSGGEKDDIKVVEERVRFSGDFGKIAGKDGLKGFVKKSGDIYGVATSSNGVAFKQTNQLAHTLDVTQLLNK